jgi:hypothetical protein
LRAILPLPYLLPAWRLLPRSVPSPSPALAEIPALRHIQEAGAQLTELGTTHGIRAVFARNGQHFQVFYLAPVARP